MQLELKASHKSIRLYYESLAKFKQLGIKHESAVRSAFQALLESCARPLPGDYWLQRTTLVYHERPSAAPLTIRAQTRNRVVCEHDVATFFSQIP